MEKTKKYIGPCGEECRSCDVRDDCPVTIEQWQEWLNVQMLDPKAKEDAMTLARKFNYMQYLYPTDVDDIATVNWIEALITGAWKDSKREYHYRYPLKGNELRLFIGKVIKETLTYRERQVVTMRLGLDTGKSERFAKMAELFNIEAKILGLIYRGAIGKLREAILTHPKWKRSK